MTVDCSRIYILIISLSSPSPPAFLNALPSDKAREDAMTQLEETLRPDMYDPVTETWTAMCKSSVSGLSGVCQWR